MKIPIQICELDRMALLIRRWSDNFLRRFSALVVAAWALSPGQRPPAGAGDANAGDLDLKTIGSHALPRCVGEPVANQSDYYFECEPVRNDTLLRASARIAGEQVERTSLIGAETFHQMAAV
jgi:hypothetical protein